MLRQNIFGVPTVQFGIPDPTTTVGSLNAATIAYSVVTPTTVRRNSPTVPVGGNSYKVVLASMGYDDTYGGYTVGISSPESTTESPASGQGILARIASVLPSNLAKAVAMSVWMEIGSQDPQLTKFSYVDPAHDWATLIMNQAIPSAPTVPFATLNAATFNPVVGGRVTNGVLWTPQVPTTGGVHFDHVATTINVSQDDTVDYSRVTARATDISFSILDSSMTTFAQGLGGDTWQFTDTNSDVVQEAQTDLYAVVATDAGNQAVKFVMPPDSVGISTYRLNIGNQIVNTVAFKEDFTKNEQFRFDYNLQHVATDTMLQSQFVGLAYKRGV